MSSRPSATAQLALELTAQEEHNRLGQNGNLSKCIELIHFRSQLMAHSKTILLLSCSQYSQSRELFLRARTQPCPKRLLNFATAWIWLIQFQLSQGLKVASLQAALFRSSRASRKALQRSYLWLSRCLLRKKAESTAKCVSLRRLYMDKVVVLQTRPLPSIESLYSIHRLRSQRFTICLPSTSATASNKRSQLNPSFKLAICSSAKVG